MSELLPCPFCGDPMEGNVTDCEAGFARGPYGSLMVQCDNPECDTLGPSSQTMEGAVAAWNTRADAALAEMGGVRVKPLVWDYRPPENIFEGWVSETPFGSVHVIHYGSHFDWTWIYGKGRADTLEAAKAAAQAAVKARMLAAIEPAPSVREAVLLEAADIVDEWYQHGEEGLPGDKLRAIAEGKE